MPDARVTYKNDCVSPAQQSMNMEYFCLIRNFRHRFFCDFLSGVFFQQNVYDFSERLLITYIVCCVFVLKRDQR